MGRVCSFSVASDNEVRRESAYKAILIVSLSFTICSWACMSSVIPLVYSFMGQTSNQFSSILEFCEDTAQTVAQDSTIILDELMRLSESDKSIALRYNHTEDDKRLRKYRQAFPMSPIQSKLNIHECRCEPAPGPKGPPGRPGLKGVSGTTGAPGKPARLPCQPLIDFKKYCPEKCPNGPQGQPGTRGLRGDKGKKGVNGALGNDGKNGSLGVRGISGPPGVSGTDGDEGDAGVDAVPSPFVPGPMGLVGETGDIGPPGPRGMPGIDGPQGTQGRRGDGGRNGLPGQRGQPGQAGLVGDPGEDGHQGVCPTYCAGDGGVFFVEPPEWFFKDH